MAMNWLKATRILPVKKNEDTAQPPEPRYSSGPDEHALFSNYRMSLPLLICWFLLLAFGFLMMFSASYGTSFVMTSVDYATSKTDGIEEPPVVAVIPEADASHLARRHAGVTLISVLLSIVFAFFVPFRQLTRKRLGYFVWFLVAPLLVACPFSAPINGARRWLNLGAFSFQPSELAKIALIFFLANYFTVRSYERRREQQAGVRALASSSRDVRDVRRDDRNAVSRARQSVWKKAYIDVTKPALMSLLWVVLVLIQPHLSGAIILILLTLVMFFLAGIPKRSLILGGLQVLAIVLVLLTLVAVLYPYFDDEHTSFSAMVDARFSYARQRVSTFNNPEAATSDERMQVTQAEIALGSGGFSGKGFGTSVQKLNWLSEAHNDFIFPIVGEELGFVGVLTVMALFLLFLVCGLSIARRANSKMARLAAAGYTIFIVLQAFLNMGVAVGIMPATGISLPFFSYGGTSNLFFCAAVGMLLCISKSATEADQELSIIMEEN
ncbi:MAG: FtsW/RodA/SpoVE family cell cycle protein [Clostridiaceae bacterium]|jgi:cell division protein FtsW|nr:FtsW/RodA/SpoVE family cell cycle protein [Clostridiaceae bacterium]